MSNKTLTAQKQLEISNKFLTVRLAVGGLHQAIVTTDATEQAAHDKSLRLVEVCMLGIQKHMEELQRRLDQAG